MCSTSLNNLYDPKIMNQQIIKDKILSRSLERNINSHEILIEMLIDDMLIDCVFDLQEIEEKQEKIKQKENMKNFVKGYYKNFEDFKKLEDNISHKLTSKNYGINLNPVGTKMILNGNEDRRHIIYKNPFSASIDKSIIDIQENLNLHNMNINNTNHNHNIQDKPNVITNIINNNNLTTSNKSNKNIKNNKIDKEKKLKKIKENHSESGSDSGKELEKEQRQEQEQEKDIQEKIKKNFLYNYAASNNNILNAIANTGTGNSKTYYVPNFHKNLPKICQNYKIEYEDYLKTTGAFFIPNVFMMYDEVVNKLTTEIFEECFTQSLKELDEMAMNLVQKEVEKDI
jgi:hypothetical protein